jgi:hypothetical protein
VIRLAPVAIALLLLPGCAATTAAPAGGGAPVGHAEFQFVGDWSGGIDASGEGITGMVVSDAAADGTTFTGDLTFVAAGIVTTEPVRASMTPHGHLVASIGAGASLEAHITDERTLDYCFIRYGSEPVYSCGRLERLT